MIISSIRASAFIALAAALAASCGTVEPGGAGANGVVFEASRNYVLRHDGVGGGGSVEVHAYAPGSISAVDAGEVALNGSAITRRNDIAAGGIFYATGWQYDQDAPVEADGSMHRLTISGNGPFAAFADSIRAPRAVNMTEPALMAALSKSKGFTVVWEGSENPGDSVTIEAHDGIYAYLLSKKVPDSGVAVLSAADLRGLSYGSVFVGVKRANTRRAIRADGRFSDMTISTAMMVEVAIGQ
jgi:hypothetical protein